MMLKIKRVPTVVSNYQKDEADEGRRVGGCGRNCLNKCCIPGFFFDINSSFIVNIVLFVLPAFFVCKAHTFGDAS